MGSILLTDKGIQTLRPKTKQYEVFDSKVRGLEIRVSPGGTKSFIILYRSGRLNRRFTLGSYGVVSLAEARRRAMEALSQVAKGIDPQSAKLQGRASYHSNLFPAVANEFIENHAKRNTRSWMETARILRKEFVRPWSNLAVQTIRKQRIHDRLDEIVIRNGPSAANHGFAVIRRCLNWCVDRGLIEKSPCAGMKAPAKTVERKRVLTADELSDVIQAADKMGHPFGPFTQILALTAQRRDEVSGMRWRDLDLDNGLWTQPEGSNKSEREHIVPLNRLSIETIRALPRLHDEFVFPARGRDRPISGYSKWKRKLDQVNAVKNWALHDLRRTAATGMAALKVQLHIVELILNHRSRQLSGIAGVYNRHEYLEERRDALELWGRHVGQLIQNAQKNAASEIGDTSGPARAPGATASARTS